MQSDFRRAQPPDGASKSSVRCPNCGHALLTVDSPIPRFVTLTPERERSVGDKPAQMLLKVSEAATLLSISRTAMYQLIATGQLPVIRLGRSIRVSRAALERLAASTDP